MTSTNRESSPSRGWILVVVALLVGGLGGGLGGYLAGGSSDVEDAELREPPEDFPNAEQNLLPGVAASAIEEWMSGNDYECEVLTDSGDYDASPRGAANWLACNAPSEHSVYADVTVEYDDDARVQAVQATCERGPTTHEDYCPSVFVGTAENVFRDQPDFQEEAVTWAEENHRNDASTVIGGVHVTVDLGEHEMEFLPAS